MAEKRHREPRNPERDIADDELREIVEDEREGEDRFDEEEDEDDDERIERS